jgi:hypothetical protein
VLLGLLVGRGISISLSKFSLHSGQIEWLIGSRGSSLSGISLKRMNLPHQAQTILRYTDSPPFSGHKKSAQDFSQALSLPLWV